MKQSKKGNQWFSGMKAYIGADADSGLVHTVRGTAGRVNDVVEANSLLHREETEAWGDAGCQGAAKRADAQGCVRWNIAMQPGGSPNGCFGAWSCIPDPRPPSLACEDRRALFLPRTASFCRILRRANGTCVPGDLDAVEGPLRDGIDIFLHEFQ